MNTYHPVEFVLGDTGADPGYRPGSDDDVEPWGESDSDEALPTNSTEVAEYEEEQDQEDAVDQETQQRKSRRKRKTLASAALVRGGRTAKLAPTVKTFACSLCSYTAKNRYDSLRRHLKGKHKLGPEELQRECAKYKVR